MKENKDTITVSLPQYEAIGITELLESLCDQLNFTSFEEITINMKSAATEYLIKNPNKDCITTMLDTIAQVSIIMNLISYHRDDIRTIFTSLSDVTQKI